MYNNPPNTTIPQQVMAKTSPTSPPLVSPTPSRSIISLLRAIVQKEGIGALWKGTGAGATRAAVLTASQCATYDEAKRVRGVGGYGVWEGKGCRGVWGVGGYRVWEGMRCVVDSFWESVVGDSLGVLVR